jgi:hypothetical protein
MQKILLLLMLMSAAAGLHAQNNNGVVFTIRYQDKQVYYPQSDIRLRASIKNMSDQDYVFELADEAFFNVDLSVRTLTNLALEPSDIYIRRTKSNETRPVLYRIINLKSGEEHSFEINLRDFVVVNEANTYVIQANFRPRAVLFNNDNKSMPVAASAAGNNMILKANPLSLTIRPFVANRSFTDILDRETNEILRQENLAPDQIISYTLRARQAEQWNKFFLYLNLEQLFRRNADRSRRYNYADVEVRAQLLENFKKDLTTTVTDSDLSTIPYEFKILSTYYTEDKAIVTTRQVYRQQQYNEIKEFKWYLNRDNENGIWMVYDYEVTNLGTER